MENTNKQLLSFYAFLKDQGFIWPNTDSDMYPPMNGHYTYGPLGSLLKNSLEKYIRMVFHTNTYEEIKCPLVYPKAVWNNSGHWDNFQDPVIYTIKGNCYRLDKLLEDELNLDTSKLVASEIIKYCYSLKNNDDDPYIIPTELQYKNLMMTTHSGNEMCALRPETATTTYTSFLSAYNHNGKKLPLGLYQIGFAFRNEINCRNLTLRMREFTQAEAHIFIDKNNKNIHPKYDEIKHIELPIYTNNEIKLITINDLYNMKSLSSQYYAFTLYLAFNLLKAILPLDKIRLRQHSKEEKAFYALDAWDIEFKLDNIGWTEICGIHDRGDYDLTQHKLKWDNIPHILEIAIGVDRVIFALLDSYYDKKEKDVGKTILHIPLAIAPIQIAVLPLIKNKVEITNKAEDIYNKLQKYFITIYDEKQAIGKRYLKCGIKGIPFCVTIDYQTLEDNTVTIRERDTEIQTRINTNDLHGSLFMLLNN